MYTVYEHITPNNKKYIGITGKKPEVRWLNGRGYAKNNHFYNAIQKYGWDNIQHLIIATNLTKEEACQTEKFFIWWYQTIDDNFGYNGTTGGDGNFDFSQETKEKMSLAKKDKKLSEQHVKNISNAHRRENLSLETREKLSQSHSGERNSHYGKHLTQEQKQALSNKLQNCGGKTIYQYTGDGEFVAKYDSLRELKRATGMARTDIGRKVDTNKKPYGFIFTSKPLS